MKCVLLLLQDLSGIILFSIICLLKILIDSALNMKCTWNVTCYSLVWCTMYMNNNNNISSVISNLWRQRVFLRRPSAQVTHNKAMKNNIQMQSRHNKLDKLFFLFLINDNRIAHVFETQKSRICGRFLLYSAPT